MRGRLLRFALAFVLIGSTLTAFTVSAQDDVDEDFRMTWARSDAAVALQLDTRTWMWGPGPYSVEMMEPYADSPGGERKVQYFDKTRMEINNPDGDRSSPWFVTNGLLAQELITGEMQVGDIQFEQREPAQVQIAGDAHPDSPTYADLEPLLDEPATPEGTGIDWRLQSDGEVVWDGTLGIYNVGGAYYVPETDHTVAGPFWEFMTSSGVIFQQAPQGGGTYEEGSLFPNPFFATGFPITAAYWVDVPVGGEWKDVLVQCFERRCLTYTPDNAPEWQVEAGNIGQHYYEWRYGESPQETPPEFLPPGIQAPDDPPVSDDPPPADDPPATCVDLNTAGLDELRDIIHIDEDRAQQIINNRPFSSIDQLEPRINGIGPARMDDIRDEGLACVQ